MIWQVKKTQVIFAGENNIYIWDDTFFSRMRCEILIKVCRARLFGMVKNHNFDPCLGKLVGRNLLDCVYDQVIFVQCSTLEA